MNLTFIPPTERSSMSKARVAKIFLKANGICHLCGKQIRDGERWEISHPDALALGGSDDDADLRPAHERCHELQTKKDQAAIAKRNRIVTTGWTGAAQGQRPFPGSRRDKFRKKVNGTVERRS